MGKYTESEINQIINLKGANTQQIDIFNLYGVLFVGNYALEGNKEMWDLTADGQFQRFSEHSLGFELDDFDSCETEDDVLDVFHKRLGEIIVDKLI